MKQTIKLIVPILLLQGCAFSVHQVHVSGFEPFTAKANSQLISASAERFTVLGFSDDTSYIDKGVTELKAKCPDKNIVGVSTEIQTALGFFSWTDRVYLRGYCIAQGEASETKTPKQPTPKFIKAKRS